MPEIRNKGRMEKKNYSYSLFNQNLEINKIVGSYTENFAIKKKSDVCAQKTIHNSKPKSIHFSVW